MRVSGFSLRMFFNSEVSTEISSIVVDSLSLKLLIKKNKFKYPTILNSVRQVTVIITRQKSKEMELTRITLCFNFLIIIDPVLAKYYNAKNY